MVAVSVDEEVVFGITTVAEEVSLVLVVEAPSPPPVNDDKMPESVDAAGVTDVKDDVEEVAEDVEVEPDDASCWYTRKELTCQYASVKLPGLLATKFWHD